MSHIRSLDTRKIIDELKADETGGDLPARIDQLKQTDFLLIKIMQELESRNMVECASLFASVSFSASIAWQELEAGK